MAGTVAQVWLFCVMCICTVHNISVCFYPLVYENIITVCFMIQKFHDKIAFISYTFNVLLPLIRQIFFLDSFKLQDLFKDVSNLEYSH